MSSPSSEAVILITGTGVATYAAILATAGYAARRFFARFDRQDADNARLLRGQRNMVAKMQPLTRRVKTLERGHREHAELLGKLTAIQTVQTIDNRKA